jgi:hypothetical protein
MVAPAEIATNDFDLSISRYVEVEAADEVELAVALAAYTESRDALTEAENLLAQRLSEFGV